jgi:hypothetical protein
MGRRSKKRRRNNRNNNRKNRAIFTPVNMEFLKRDGDVGLFRDRVGDKYRVHKEHVYGTLSWLKKGTFVSVRKEYINEVKNKRLVVSNPYDMDAPIEEQPQSGHSYTYENDIKVVATEYDVARLGFPIGTQYHHITFSEAPRIGDFVAGMRTSPHKHVMGEVTDVCEDSALCIVGDNMCPINDIGYKIINPKFLLNHKFANA